MYIQVQKLIFLVIYLLISLMLIPKTKLMLLFYFKTLTEITTKNYFILI